ncbi:unnamed protein product [Somion occarium]|uniref:Uncharacterized protein n=1 Tax=Somion occarium TaxID=3059160 RepID=A0ABP1CZW4_9APHY
MLSALINKPNHVPELQRKVQAAFPHEPVYYAKPHGKLYVRTYYGFFAAGVLGVLYGSYSLLFTKPKRGGE